MRIFQKMVSFIICLLLGVQIFAQNEDAKKVLLSHADNFRIDSLVYYRNPFVAKNFLPLDDEYTPVWLQAYLVRNRPQLFDEYIDSILKYTHSSMSRDTAILLEMRDGQLQVLAMLESENNKPLFEYTVGEIWFTEIKTNISVVSVSHFYQEDSLLLNFDMDSEWEMHSNLGADLYVFQDGIAKKMGYELFKALELDNYKFWQGTDLNIIRSEIPTYTRSYIKKNIRYFETIKNTPEGPIVIDTTEKKGGLNKWLIVIGGVLIVFVIMVLLLFKGKKKYHE